MCEKVHKKMKNDNLIILNPSLQDILHDNIYKLEIEEKTFYVPLWCNEVEFAVSDDQDVIVKCNCELPSNITIDNNNNIKKRVVSLFNDLGLIDKLDKKPATLSGGERQRVSIARLLIQNPMVVLADEPVSSLDPTRAEDIMQLIKSKLVTENRSVIITLHNTKLIQNYCSRLIGIKEHSVVFDVSSDHINEEMLSELYK